GLLPGSREKEVKYLLPVLLRAARLIRENIPEARFIIPLTSATFKSSSSLNEQNIRNYIFKTLPDAILTVDETYNVYPILDFAIVASGTATLEAACASTPMIIIYRVSLLTEFLARISGRLPLVFGLPNIIMGRRVISEFAQRDANPVKIAREVTAFYFQGEKVQEQKDFLQEIKKKMGEPGATERAASVVIDFLQEIDQGQQE
ncbi:MAG: hypothetical protein PHQ23_00145, partial [Candidatus Wallbacteria bacterium]|nr:hypothetical protein [Candidatus Wallbacteria bacterium]